MAELLIESLRGRALDIWNLLVQADGRLVTKNEIMERLWPGAVVGENNLQVHVSALRRALGEHRHILQTVSGRGYRLLPDWQSLTANSKLPGTTRTVPTISSFLPLPIGNLFGREDALQEVLELVRTNRLVTLTGMGGIGKTQLGLAAARRVVTGAALVELATIRDEAQISQHVSTALRLVFAGGTPSLPLIAEAIGTNELLIVLDNCEHLTMAAAKAAEHLLRACPALKVLATSREPLWAHGEVLYHVPGLNVSGKEPRDDALGLFIARVRAVSPQFTFGDAELAAAASACNRLHGIPLAIELAAPTAATIGVERLEAGLDDRFSLLAGAPRTALPQHQTLRATMDWSYDLLSEREAITLYRLAVFAGEFDFDAAYDVAGVDMTTGDFCKIVTALVTKSLLVFDANARPPRYSLLETTRAYAQEKAIAAGNPGRISRRHAEYVMRRLDKMRSAKDRGVDSKWFDESRREIDDLNFALDWAFSPDGDPDLAIRLCAAGAAIFLELSMVAECRRRVEAALTLVRNGLSINPSHEMVLNACLGTALTFTVGPTARSNAAWGRLLEVSSLSCASAFQGRALWGLWTASIYGGAPRKALELAKRFQTLADDDPDAADSLMALRMIGVSHHFLGDQDEAAAGLLDVIRRYDHSAARPNTAGYRVNQSLVARAILARVEWLRGNETLQLTSQAIDEAREGDHVMTRCYVLVEAGIPILLSAGRLVPAEECLEILLSDSRRHGLDVWEAWASCYRSELEIAQGDLKRGARSLAEGLQRLEKTGFTAHYVRFVGLLAEALLARKALSDATTLVSTAISNCRRNGNAWYLPELLRIDARLKAEANDMSGEKARLMEAIDLARSQNSRLWIAKAATALARSHLADGKVDGAKAVLRGCGPIGDAVMPDMVRVKELLYRLS